MTEMATKNTPVRRPHGNRIVQIDVPATKCLNCGHVWRDRSTRRTTRIMCPKCKTARPEHFEPTVRQGYMCKKCDTRMYPLPDTVKAGRVYCRKCGAYLVPGALKRDRRKQPAV